MAKPFACWLSIRCTRPRQSSIRPGGNAQNAVGGFPVAGPSGHCSSAGPWRSRDRPGSHRADLRSETQGVRRGGRCGRCWADLLLSTLPRGGRRAALAADYGFLASKAAPEPNRHYHFSDLNKRFSWLRKSAPHAAGGAFAFSGSSAWCARRMHGRRPWRPVHHSCLGPGWLRCSVDSVVKIQCSNTAHANPMFVVFAVAFQRGRRRHWLSFLHFPSWFSFQPSALLVALLFMLSWFRALPLLNVFLLIAGLVSRSLSKHSRRCCDFFNPQAQVVVINSPVLHNPLSVHKSCLLVLLPMMSFLSLTPCILKHLLVLSWTRHSPLPILVRCWVIAVIAAGRKLSVFHI